MGHAGTRAPAAAVAALLLLATGALQAQPVAGLGEDAIPVPARAWRLSLGATWDQWDRRLLGDGSTGPLLGGLAAPTFGPSQLPALAEAESGIRTLLGRSDFGLTLGPLEATGAVRRATSLLQAELGVTRRVSVGIRVPYVEVVHDAQLVLNRFGVDANVGANPAFADRGAANANGSVHFTLQAARATLAGAISSCAIDGTGDVCDAIRANPGAAASLLARTAAFAASWLAVYGNGTLLGAPVVPITGSAEHDAIGAVLRELGDEFSRYGVTSLQRAVPNGATFVYGSEGLQTLARDSAFGLMADTLGGAFRAGMGDVDLEARVLLFDRWRANQAERLTNGQSGVRLLASAGWRFGTASSVQANEPFALATGDGVNALLLRATADAVWRKWAWVSVTARSTAPRPDQAVVRLPGAGVSDLFFLGTPQSAQRSLGHRFDLEIAPRINLGEKLGLSATWVRRATGGDRYVTSDGTEFRTPSGSAQFGAIGITYSTLAPFVRGNSRRAVEILFAHEVALNASGMVVPALVRDRLELRVYRGFPRR
jgi:hypothetical protein